MSRLDSISGKVMDLVGQAGDTLRTAVPDTATKWLQTGAALGVAKTGTRVVGTFIKRNPAVAVAAAVGAGVIWFAARRHQKKKQQQGEVIEGKSRRVEARKAAPRTRRTVARKATPTTE